MKTLLFIRHAESTSNTQPHIIGGRMSHVELTEKGEEQAKVVGQYLSDNHITPNLVYRSPAVRTRQTADRALEAAGLKLDVRVMDDLQEITHGSFEGKHRHEVYTPERNAEMNRIGKQAKLPDPDAESMAEVGERMEVAARKIVGELPDGGVALIFSHGMAIRCLVSDILGWSRQKTQETHTPNTSITKIVVTDDGEWRVEYIAQADHLNS